LLNNTTGSNNTAIGNAALIANTTASNNTAVGYQALYTNTTGTEQVAVGLSALYAATTGTGRNTAIGYQALASVTTGFENTGLGRNAGLFSTGSQNTFIGANAGATHTTGNSNTYVGEESGTSMTTGGSNTIIGRYSGNQGGLDIRTASNNIVLSDGDGNPRWRCDSTGQEFTLIVGVGLYASYSCRAWVNFNGTGTVAIRASGNVSSITDNGSGDYTVNLTTAMPDGNYSAVSSGGTGSNNIRMCSCSPVSATSTSQIRVLGITVGAGSLIDLDVVSFAIFR
jgi:hypothetical protein